MEFAKFDDAVQKQFGQRAFNVGQRVVTNHGHKGEVVKLDVIELADDSIWWNASNYYIQFENGNRMIMDLIDAHHTFGGCLKAA